MKKLLVFILAILAVISVIVGLFYLTHTAGNLPHFFIGYLKNSTLIHTKHGIAFIILAVVLLIGAWMLSGGNNKSPNNNEKSDIN